MANSFVAEVAGYYLNLDCCRRGWNIPEIAEETSTGWLLPAWPYLE